MIGLEEAQARWLSAVSPLDEEDVDLPDICGRFLARDISAKLTQPPVAVSAMDGYAIRFADLPGPWRVIGESAAGRGFDGGVDRQTAVRIFTGAPLPPGADTILIQEEAAREGETLALTAKGPTTPGENVRRAGLDVVTGDTIATRGTRIAPALVGLLAAAGHAAAPVHRRPRIAMIATGNELVAPGTTPGPDQIVESNSTMLGAMVRRAGGRVVSFAIVRDDLDALIAAIGGAADADLIVTVGGASVGDHDLVGRALAAAGARIDFWKVAIRPGKPVMTGTLGRCRVLGLPGNPVSAFVCALLFGVPVVRAMAGDANPLPRTATARSSVPLPANGARRDFMRATVCEGIVTPAAVQDSAMLSVLAAANALVVRPPHAPPVAAGEQVVIMPLDSDSFAS